MNILYINHYAGSLQYGMEFRPYFLAKEWNAMGFNTTILAADFSHLRKENPKIEEDFQEIMQGGVKYSFVKTLEYKGNGVKRILNIMEFVSKLRLNAKAIADKYKPHVVICSSTYPFDTYAGQKIAEYSGARLLHEIHDLWPLTPMELGGYSKHHPYIALMAQAEKSAYKKSYEVISILPNIKPYIDSLNIYAKVVHVPNGVVLEKNEERLTANSEIQKKVHLLKEQGFFVVGYAGGLSVSNAMEDLLKAAELLKDEPIAFMIIGQGIDKEKLEEFKENHSLDNVYFTGAINKGEIHSTLLEMDALYIGSHKSRLYTYGMSANKIFDYMLTGKPVINALDTKHTPLDYAGASFKAEAENPESIKAAILKAKDLTPERLQEIKAININYVEKNHNYRNLAETFAKEFF